MVLGQLSLGSVLIFAWLLRTGYAGAFHASVSRAEAAESPQPATTSLKTVVINHFKYQPDPLNANLGDTVEWKNIDIVPHTVTSADAKGFDSGRITKRASWRFKPTKKGTYNYLCTLHPNMRGKLIVE